MAELVVQIAYCPVHGLHGSRSSCFACGGPMEQVEFVAADDVAALEAELAAARARIGNAEHAPSPPDILVGDDGEV